MVNGEILNKLIDIVGKENIEKNVDMKRNTSFKVGGPADLMIKPQTVEEIRDIVSLLSKSNIKFLIIGNGSNLLVKDEGIRDVVIKIDKNFGDIIVENDKIIAQAGALLPLISNEAVKHSLSGFEFAAGIPGTLGGAVCMNAGAHGGEMKDIITTVTLMDYSGNIKTLTNEEMKFEYRKSIISNEPYIVLAAEMKLNKGNKEEIKSRINELRAKRVNSQPLNKPSAGSTFKRPLNNFAGKLIEDAGLKGFSIGNAVVSEKHAGFIVNDGNASAKDILTLINHVKTVVNEKYNILLEEEVKIIG